MSPIVGNEAFLAACIKYAKEKVTVDFEALAKELKMSKGGAANKFRTIMKQLEEDGAVWNSMDDQADPKSTSTTGVKRKATTKKGPRYNLARIDPVGRRDVSSDEATEQPPPKKARGKATKTNAPKLGAGDKNDEEKKPKGKGVKKISPATPSDGCSGDDEATPIKKEIKTDVPNAKMIEPVGSVTKTDTVPPKEGN
ncbi:hypothetical protein Z517_10721 [Fonsecaea pedrosoi CBS 271.37]|uniref:Myb-like DNA-binding domain-containing protein n=1 Tax=Fonsecaea pedrosoi CBS 271.37 TaxID=1442368 RepID=A0A0D2DE98_9EURO|nr:uncharacterized protein Z517_10721 [Fonsecaea pedrosoi CBS 271.37]KIW75976.1 hypothetical protein Z517_10721 [Fonsecaea pedrosoi CBS 271.37]